MTKENLPAKEGGAPVRESFLAFASPIIEEEALKDPYFIERKLYPNVDFYSGIIYKALGIPDDMFTVMFALGRIPGWLISRSSVGLEQRKSSVLVKSIQGLMKHLIFLSKVDSFLVMSLLIF